MNIPKYIFSDFDGTISKKDVINTFITTFSKGDWSIAENKWIKGEISTAECLKIQFDLITGLKIETFNDFLDTIEIDPYFKDFYNFTKKIGSKIIILSDGFDLFIEAALRKHGIEIPVFANKLTVTEKNGYVAFNMEYPNYNKNCKIGSGCCKCNIAQNFADDFIYIGDGLSDRCIAKKSSLLYAKCSLEAFCKKENIKYIPYNTFQDITVSLHTGEIINGAARNYKELNRSGN